MVLTVLKRLSQLLGSGEMYFVLLSMIREIAELLRESIFTLLLADVNTYKVAHYSLLYCNILIASRSMRFFRRNANKCCACGAKLAKESASACDLSLPVVQHELIIVVAAASDNVH